MEHRTDLCTGALQGLRVVQASSYQCNMEGKMEGYQLEKRWCIKGFTKRRKIGRKMEWQGSNNIESNFYDHNLYCDFIIIVIMFFNNILCFLGSLHCSTVVLYCWVPMSYIYINVIVDRTWFKSTTSATRMTSSQRFRDVKISVQLNTSPAQVPALPNPPLSSQLFSLSTLRPALLTPSGASMRINHSHSQWWFP